LLVFPFHVTGGVIVADEEPALARSHYAVAVRSSAPDPLGVLPHQCREMAGLGAKSGVAVVVLANLVVPVLHGLVGGQVARGDVFSVAAVARVFEHALLSVTQSVRSSIPVPVHRVRLVHVTVVVVCP